MKTPFLLLLLAPRASLSTANYQSADDDWCTPGFFTCYDNADCCSGKCDKGIFSYTGRCQNGPEALDDSVVENQPISTGSGQLSGLRASSMNDNASSGRETKGHRDVTNPSLASMSCETVCWPGIFPCFDDSDCCSGKCNQGNYFGRCESSPEDLLYDSVDEYDPISTGLRASSVNDDTSSSNPFSAGTSCEYICWLSTTTCKDFEGCLSERCSGSSPSKNNGETKSGSDLANLSLTAISCESICWLSTTTDIEFDNCLSERCSKSDIA